MNITHFVPGLTFLFIKRATDILGGLIGTLIFLAAYPIVALLIKMDSKGPVIYSQVRVGVNRRKADRRKMELGKVIVLSDRRQARNRRKDNISGKTFKLYKFRTMTVDAEANGPQLCAKQGDARITKIGKVLRWFHIDELPQFYNVLIGDMSLIGPRPERPFFTAQYVKEIPHYEERTRYIKPGITGLAQITLGYDESLQTVNYKYYYDITYRISLSSFSSWIKMETWIYRNTLKYLGFQVIQAVESAIHRKVQMLVDSSVATAKRDKATIAHPFKMIYHIHKSNQVKGHHIRAPFRTEEFQTEAIGN